MTRVNVDPARDWHADPTGTSNSRTELVSAINDAHNNRLPLYLAPTATYMTDVPIVSGYRCPLVIDMSGCPSIQGGGTILQAPQQAFGAQGSEAAVVILKNGTGNSIHMTVDVNGQHQTSTRSNGLQGYVCHGLRLQAMTNPNVTASVLNPLGTTTLTVAGVKVETFAFQDLGGNGGTFNVQVTNPGRAKSATGIVFQMRSATAAAWTVTDYLAANLGGQGIGCFQGGHGTIMKGASKYCAAHGVNIEAGPGGTPSITIGTVTTTHCGLSVVVNGNGATVGTVKINGLHSISDTGGITLAGASCQALAISSTSFVDPATACITFGTTNDQAQVNATTITGTTAHSTASPPRTITKYAGLGAIIPPSRWLFSIV